MLEQRSGLRRNVTMSHESDTFGFGNDIHDRLIGLARILLKQAKGLTVGERP